MQTTKTSPVAGLFWARLFLALTLALTALAGVLRPARAANAIIRVKAGGVNIGPCGWNWDNAACDLLHALKYIALSGDQIWVKAGTYKPIDYLSLPTDLRTMTFQLKDGVAIYGGFAGTETTLNQRNWITNVVILSGDLNGNDVGFTNNGENVYHVVTGTASNSVVLDGVTIRGGNANGVSNNCGGGMFNSYNGDLTLTNVVFSGNMAAMRGGGMCNSASRPKLTNVTFSGNMATETGSYGGGMDIITGGPWLTNVVFSGNSADYGGGMSSSISIPTLTNVTFSGNVARHVGGGGAMDISGYASPIVRNSILWGDRQGTTTSEIVITGGGGIDIAYSDVEGGYTGTGNINADPKFNAPVSAAAAPTTGGDLRLQSYSPAINKGSDAATTATIDRDGQPRKVGVVDMGAYENQTPSTAVLFVDGAAAPTPDGVQLTWFTTPEAALLGFRLYRADSETGERSLLTPALILADGRTGYDFTDAAALPNRPYYYWIEAVSPEGAVQQVGPLFAARYAVFLPALRR